jgi:uncharacterized delta-60 repeat protein
VGYTRKRGNDTFPSVYLAKLDSEGKLDSSWDPNPKTLGGEVAEEAYSIQQTADGGFIVTGWTVFGAGEGDVYVAKLDSEGNLDPGWDPNPKIFGGEDREEGHCVQQTSDGGYIVAGWTSSFGASYSEACVIKLDSQGNLYPAWDPNPKTFDGPPGYRENARYRAQSVRQTSDGGYIVVGWARPSGSDYRHGYMIKLDSQGNLDRAWDRNPVIVKEDETFGADLKSVQQTEDGGYVIAGQNGYHASSAYVWKLAPARHFLRGDCDADGSAQGIPDAMFLLRYIFLGTKALPCLAACDANGEETVDISDAIYVLSYFFRGGEAPPTPFPDCGLGVVRPHLGCETEPECP